MTSYFGMRDIKLAKLNGVVRPFINDKFMMQLGLLDQGYWPDGILTAPTEEALKFDIEYTKNAGYNLIRKHMKTEPQRFYYWADKLGLLVWQDMPAIWYQNEDTTVTRRVFRQELKLQKTLDKYGRIDAIHNNAGIASPSKPLHETSDEEWDQLMNVNLKSVLLTTRYGFKALQKSKGCILNTSSLVGDIGQENHAAYTATKGGMNALTKSMALDYAKDKIRVNAVMPAGVWTPMLREWSKEQSNASSIEKYLDDIHPLGYCPDGDAIADACVFLLSDKARFITGTTLAVSGGAELGYRRSE